MNDQNWYINVLELIFLSVCSYFDLKNQEIPVKCLLFFCMFGIAGNIILKYQTVWDVFAGACVGGVFLIVGCLTREAIGYGDGWGLVILGVIKGWWALIPVLFGAFLLSGVYGIWRLIGLKASLNETVPFYPFLLAASVGVYLI